VKNNRLTRQISYIFTGITIFIGLIFIFIYLITIRNIIIKNVSERIKTYSTLIVSPNIEHGFFPDTDPIKFPATENNGLIYLKNGIIKKEIKPLNDAIINIEGILIHLTQLMEPTYNIVETIFVGNIQVFYLIYFNHSFPDNIIIIYSSTIYEMQNYRNIIGLVIVLFLIFIILGNLLVWSWSAVTSKRITRMKNNINDLVKSNYSKPIEVYGNDELTSLIEAVEKLRKEITNNIRMNQEVLQNISHDLKTPITIIKSYAEAIKDGITEIEDIAVIIAQADRLNTKISQLIQLNYLSYFSNEAEFYQVKINTVLTTLLDNMKFSLSDFELTFDFDNSILIGTYENFLTIYGNILENTLRYAHKNIKIVLKNGCVKIFNDGPHISDGFIHDLFKPYKKGEKGQFGLGLSIVQETCIVFDLNLTVENVIGGVIFKIMPNPHYKFKSLIDY